MRAYKQGKHQEQPCSKKLENPTSLTFTTADGQHINFTNQDGLWQAEVEGYTSNGSLQHRQLPVVFELGYTLEDLVTKDPTEQQQLIHVCPNRVNIDQEAYVNIGKYSTQAEVHEQYISKIATKQPNKTTLADHLQPNAEISTQDQPSPQALPTPWQATASGSDSRQFAATRTAPPARKQLSPMQSLSTKPAPNRKVLSLRSQNELLASQRAAQQKRATRVAMVKPDNEPIQTAQPSAPTPTQAPSQENKQPQDISSQVFQAQGGQRVHFIYKNDQWQASVLEQIGMFSHVAVLPVACQGHGDIEKTLLSLLDKPDRYTQQRIHVMTTRQVPYVPKFVYLGEQSLKGGMHKASEPSGSGSLSTRARAYQARSASIALKERMNQENITSTASLVEALNAAQTPEEKQNLKEWVDAYITWFNREPVGNLTKQQGAATYEYSLLAGIRADNKMRKELLRDYFNSLCNRIKEGQYGEEPLIEALERTLQTIDNGMFEGNTTQLIDLGKELLARLDPKKTTFSKKENYLTHRSILYALHQVLVLIRQLDSQWDPNQKEGLYQQFKAQCEAITQESSCYYPVCYHVRLLKQSLQRLESADPQVRLQDNLRRVGQGLHAALYFCQGISSLYKLDFDIKAFSKGGQRLRDAFTSQLIHSRPWYELHQALYYDCLLSLEDPAEYDEFNACLQSLLPGLKEKGLKILSGWRDKRDKKEDRKALRYGIVQQLSLLALRGPTAEVRQQSVGKLISLSGAWSEEDDILEEILDRLAMIATHSQGEAKELAQEALVNLTNSKDVKKTIPKWLGGKDLQEKLESLSSLGDKPDLDDLFHKINKELRGGDTVESLSPAGAKEVRQALRDFYQQSRFTQVNSLFVGEVKSIETLQCQLKVVEQKVQEEVEKVKEDGEFEEASQRARQDDLTTYHERLERGKTPIALEELFKARSMKPGEPAREIHKVLLVGDPGTGKTTLSKKLAYSWAQDKWGKEFKAVYVLPVRALQKSEYDHVSMRREATLATAIANNCFTSPPSEEKGYKCWRLQISEELAKPTTLVVLDGLDERYGTNEKLLEEAQGGKHKLLMLSRPYGIEAERDLADIEIEHAGFSDEQLEAYIRDELSPGLDEELLAFIIKHPAIGSIAHVPVNLQILCALWKDNQASVRKETKNDSLPELYRKLARYIWERYAEKLKHKEQRLQNKDREGLFDTLGKIALGALQRGEVLISQGLLDEGLEEAPVSREMLQESGFLEKVGNQYQFLHTFQDYFAGRWLAGQFLSRSEQARKVRELVTKHKYERQYGVTLTFMAGEVSNKQGIEGIRQLLSLLDEEPRDMVGVQHVLLQMRLLNEWLCVAGEDFEEDLYKLEEEFHVLKTFKEWFDKGMEQVMSKDDRKLLTLLTITLQESRAAAGHALLQFNPLEIKYQSARISIFRTLLSLVKKAAPQHAPWLLESLLEACKDRNPRVRSFASSALEEVVKISPGHAPEVLPSLIRASKDTNLVVRLTALEALRSVFEAMPEVSEEILDFLLGVGVCEDAKYIRDAAIKALVPVVQATPQHAKRVLSFLLDVSRDTEPWVRSAATSALGKIVEASPSEAPSLVEALLKACKHANKWIRGTTLETLGKLVQANSQYAEQVLEPLLGACQDTDADVRLTALKALEILVQAAPRCAEQVLKPLLGYCEDTDADVRLTTIKALVSVVKIFPEHIEEVLNLLLAACWGAEAVRLTALKGLEALVQVAPQYAEQILRPLLAACRDVDTEAVRLTALKALVSVVKVSSKHIEQVLPPLLAACQDADAEAVRLTALKTLEALVQAAPQYVEQGLKPLLAACRRDVDTEAVRLTALKALVSVVKASPEHIEQVLNLLLATCRDTDAEAVRITALDILISVVQATPPKYAQQVLEPLLGASQDTDEDVCLAASKALEKIPLQHLIKDYWTIQDQVLILPIVSQLYYTPLIVRSPNLYNQQKLILYPTSGVTIEWDKPSEEVQRFELLIKSATQQLNTAFRSRDIASYVSRNVKASPEHAKQLLKLLEEFMLNKAPYVRRLAISALKEVVEVSPEHTSKIIQFLPLLAVCEDADPAVRRDAVKALVLVAKTSPQYVDQVFKSLLAVCKDADPAVRCDAVKALVSVVQAAPRCAEQVLKPLLAVCEDADLAVRCDAVKALAPVAEASPQHVDQVLDLLLKACRDNQGSEMWRVHLAAKKTLKSVVQTTPKYADKILPLLLTARQDANSDVRGVAISALRVLVKASPEHAEQAFPQEQGKSLLKASAEGDIEKIKSLVEQGSAINATENNVRTPLHSAAINGHQAVVQYLQGKGLVINATDKHGNTPLHLASFNGHQAVVQYLLEQGSSINATDNYGGTPLHSAAAKGHREVAEYLIEQGADIKATDKRGKTPLRMAAANGHREVEAVLKEAAPGEPKSLLEAAAEGDIAKIRSLLEQGLGINATDKHDNTPLHLASFKGHQEVVQYLIEQSANINATNEYGRTSLHSAAENGHRAVVQYLQGKGSAINATDKYGNTPLHLAAEKGDKELVIYLKDQGGDIDATDKYGRTPLQLALSNGYTELEAILRL